MDWQKFIDGELAVYVTPDNIESFLRACEERGLKWRSGDLPTRFCPPMPIQDHVQITITHNFYYPPLYGLGVAYDNCHSLPVVDWGSELNE